MHSSGCAWLMGSRIDPAARAEQLELDLPGLLARTVQLELGNHPADTLSPDDATRHTPEPLKGSDANPVPPKSRV